MFPSGDRRPTLLQISQSRKFCRPLFQSLNRELEKSKETPGILPGV